MKITGELLKTERLKQNMSVQDAAFSLKLSSKIINSIEAGETEELPAKTFVRGFVKSYAQLLKADVDQVMRQFQEEMGSTQPMPKTPPPLSSPNAAGETAKPEKKDRPTPVQTLNNDQSKKTFVYIGIAVVLVILIITTNKVIDKYQKDRSDNANISQVKPLDPIAAPPILGDSISKMSVPLTPTGLSSDPVVDPGIVPTNSAPLANKAPDTSTLSLTPDEGFSPSTGKPVEVIIEAKKDIELQYAKGSNKTFSKLKLQSKQIQVIRSPDGLYLQTEDGGALHLIVNGIEKGTAGGNNKPVKLTF